MNTSSSEFEEYGPEPNMKLSHAFLVVLLLHVIAVGGIYAFNSLKASKAPKLTASKMTIPSETPTETSTQRPPQQETPKNRPPSEEKGSLVARKIEPPKTSEKVALEKAPKKLPKVTEKSSVANLKSDAPVPKSFLATAGSAFQRLTGFGIAGSAAASVATANAQESINTEAVALPAETASAAKTYIVKAGDSLTKIATSLGVSIPDLEKANGMVSSTILRVGQSLTIPAKVMTQVAADVTSQAGKAAESIQQLPGTVASAATGVTASLTGGSNAPVADMAEYTVAKGDSPYKIAKKFKVTPDALMKANNITDPKKIQIGQKLKIPSAAKQAEKQPPVVP
jgi:LysM repeat protein